MLRAAPQINQMVMHAKTLKENGAGENGILENHGTESAGGGQYAGAKGQGTMPGLRRTGRDPKILFLLNFLVTTLKKRGRINLIIHIQNNAILM